MAFKFSTAASASDFGSATNSPQGWPNVKDGPELREIQTNELGFAGLNGESKVQLLPTPWPSDDLPPPSASLLSVASAKGLLAAAGPDALYIAPTAMVRAAFQSPAAPDRQSVRPFTPDVKIPQPRLSHVAFSSDENVLVVSTEKEGDILAFQVGEVQKGHLEPVLRISTNGQSLRALIPNPVPESAALFALITTNGDLMLLDLVAGTMVSGSNGSVLKSGACCLSWSNKGKQLAVGMADGTVIQMKPEGDVVAHIPKSTSIPPSMHVSGISWLENDSFFIIYTPNDTSHGIQPSEYYIINREPKANNYTFQRLPEVLPPFGVERLPPSHFIVRLRNFQPHILDLLVVAATAATDIGLISKTNKALSQEDQVTSAFTFTTIEDDARRAELPLSADMQDTSPIGMVLDLSSSEKVPNPIPAEQEILETVGPVPCLVVLNNEGILVAWWIIYNDSVRQKTTFSGLAPLQAIKESPSSSSAAPTATDEAPSNASPFTKPTPANFGVSASQSRFGTPATKPFGTSSPVASDKPSWATTGFGSPNGAAAEGSNFGTPAFGSVTPIGGSATPAFGSTSALGSRLSTFGRTPTLGGPPSFGQPSLVGAGTNTSPFASAGVASTGSGFASFSNEGGFSSFARAKTDQNALSPFGAPAGTSIFGQTSEKPFGVDSKLPFGQAKPIGSQSSFGNTGSFKLQSSFQGDGSAKDDLPKPTEPSGFGLGGFLDGVLGESKQTLSPTHDQETEMGEEGVVSDVDSEKAQDTSFEGSPSQNSAQPPQTLVTPPSTLSQPKATPAPPESSLFGQPSNHTTTPQPQTTTPGWSFNGISSTTPKETPMPSHMTLFGTTTAANDTPAAVAHSEPAVPFAPIQHSPQIKEEPPSENESVDLKNIPEPPLPPDPVSKPRYASGETSISSNISKTPPDDAPLPPDFLPPSKSVEEPASHQPLPDEEVEPEHDQEEDGFSSDFEGSGEDVTGDVSAEEDATEEQHDQLQTSPESSFKSGDRSTEVSPTGGLFTKVSSTPTAQKPARPLFGEVGTGPIFAPPKPQESPRSPSPVRNVSSVEGLRVDPTRSVSAPAHPRSIIHQRKAEYQKSSLAAQAARTREEEVAKENARREAMARQKAQEEAEQLEPLQDDEDEILRQELERPISPMQSLDDFVTYQPKPGEESSKTGIPAQIERLYADINSMVYTLGINCRSLSAFLQYQQPKASNQSWPSVLKSETPMDALNDERLLTDITRLHDGQNVLSALLAKSQVDNFGGKIQQCQALLAQDLFELRTKLTTIRKTIHALASTDNGITAPLSAEQASIQHDLRKAFTSVQSKLIQTEDSISVLRAKLARSTSADSGTFGRTASPKKPTVEAVTKTVGKMMSMAEQKSADIDILEAQLKKMDLSLASSTLSNGDRSGGLTNVTTPQRHRQSVNGATPGTNGSVYHTPDSKLGNSTRSNRSWRASFNGAMVAISIEDRERWRAQSRRRKEATDTLKGVLEEKRKRTTAKR
ncbi:uncharacterized protein Z518_04080 [Rhinocladiella mackenziei CBS 650.93]|uniref:Nucleoporin Nup159/Nup146 N-terminal domain-containing protein n=1 Tax=Rhinocladiella mackenziei CBS 650.93 TaxID=1442369 RepID=A0A0D2ISJ0_9EURO|nr:uncharacterized protein Z518_04080 [Rhinocladiella mackenziei CBS 650.93]KIX06106.1 hypothetical protein Z518_04080 [Rhinocladiella mackenziei CBS 650.93]